MLEKNGRDRSAIFTLGVLAVTAVAIILILIAGRPRSTKVALTTPRPPRTPEPTITPAPLTVYVTGAVARPDQQHVLPPDSRVEAAIAAAGGALPDADLSRVNLADKLQDGAQIHVPVVAQEEPAPLPTPIGGIKININTASVEELDSLPGIGPALAQRIIEYRTANGAFTTLDELNNVSGIGPALLDGLRDAVRFD